MTNNNTECIQTTQAYIPNQNTALLQVNCQDINAAEVNRFLTTLDKFS